jgi:hypothetical protein
MPKLNFVEIEFVKKFPPFLSLTVLKKEGQVLRPGLQKTKSLDEFCTVCRWNFAKDDHDEVN